MRSQESGGSTHDYPLSSVCYGFDLRNYLVAPRHLLRVTITYLHITSATNYNFLHPYYYYYITQDGTGRLIVR